jgi:sugar lactone lactonase YvrE
MPVAGRKTMKAKPLLTTPYLALITGLFSLISACSPIQPLSYEPPEAPVLEGPTAPNDALRNAQPLGVEKLGTSEDLAVDDQGRIYGGTEDGRILRLTIGRSGEENVETFAETGGRPLGLDFDPAGNLIVADAIKGLLAVEPDGNVRVLSTGANNVPFRVTDDVDVASDGRIYFSDASSVWGMDELLYDLLEARPNGRLLRYNPMTEQTEVLLGGLYFANGVALSKDEDFVLVNETYRYRTTRYWLAGPKTGTSEVFIDNLPGFPDGVSGNGKGTFWLTLFTIRNPTADWLHPRPWLKSVLSTLPGFLWPSPEPYGLVLALDEQGQIRESLQDPTGEIVKEVTSAEEHDGFLYLGSLHGDRVWRYSLGKPGN